MDRARGVRVGQGGDKNDKAAEGMDDKCQPLQWVNSGLEKRGGPPEFQQGHEQVMVWQWRFSLEKQNCPFAVGNGNKLRLLHGSVGNDANNEDCS